MALTVDTYYKNILGKILDEDSLLKKRQHLKRNKAKLVFTNGCFDILHRGHVQYLAHAKSLGHYLLVAVNDDASITRLKGKTRPIMDVQSRTEVLASLSVVDFVTVFAQDTPYELIANLLPDVLVKGGDWAIEKIVGSDVVQKNGGTILALPYLENNSTTGIVERIIAINK